MSYYCKGESCITVFTLSTDGDKPVLSEMDLVNRFRSLLSDNELERLARWAWHSKPYDTFNIGRIVVMAWDRDDT